MRIKAWRSTDFDLYEETEKGFKPGATDDKAHLLETFNVVGCWPPGDSTRAAPC